jgi:anti-sigma factor RsiW
MDCPQIQNELPVYQSGELPAADAERVRQHLAGCANCRQALDELSQTATLLKSQFAAAHAHQEVPSAVWEKLETSLRATEKPRRLLTPRRFGIAAAALVLALLAVLLFIPPVSARVGALLSSWLRIDVPGSQTTLTIDDFSAFTPWAPTWLPAGFDLTTSGTYIAPGVDELSLIYAKGKQQIVLLQRKESSPAPLPVGIAVGWGEVRGVYDDISPTIPPEITVQFPGEPVRLLAWKQGGLSFVLYSNLEKDAMLRVAESLRQVQR